MVKARDIGVLSTVYGFEKLYITTMVENSIRSFLLIFNIFNVTVP